METDKGISIGLPSVLKKALDAFIDHGKAQKAVNDNEVCGLFLFHASDWVPGTGWIGEVVYKAVPNLAMDEGGFEMDPVASAMFMSEAVDLREKVASAVCARMGWDENTSWSVACKADAVAQIAELRSDNIDVSAQQEEDHIARALYEEMEDMAVGFRDTAFVAVDGKMSAHTWLMVRGVTVLCGIGHSHPGGAAELSPEDMLACKTVEQWRNTFQVRFATEGQKTGSALELSKPIGNWIYALAQDDSADSSLVRYDARGLRAKWTGPF